MDTVKSKSVIFSEVILDLEGKLFNLHPDAQKIYDCINQLKQIISEGDIVRGRQINRQEAKKICLDFISKSDVGVSRKVIFGHFQELNIDINETRILTAILALHKSGQIFRNKVSGEFYTYSRV